MPSPGYESIRNYYAFYPGRMDACYVGEEQVKRQPGDFYGGWITANITGPFKGTRGQKVGRLSESAIGQGLQVLSFLHK